MLVDAPGFLLVFRSLLPIIDDMNFMKLNRWKAFVAEEKEGLVQMIITTTFFPEKDSG